MENRNTAGAVIPVGVPLSPRNIYLREPVFSITQTASRLMRTTLVAACISGGLLFTSGGLHAQQRPAVVGDAKQYATDIGSLPKDATHVAVLVQLPGRGHVVAASSHALRQEEGCDVSSGNLKARVAARIGALCDAAWGVSPSLFL